jgi:hypothetical protein
MPITLRIQLSGHGLPLPEFTDLIMEFLSNEFIAQLAFAGRQQAGASQLSL